MSIFIALFLLSCGRAPTGTSYMVIKGSDTEVNLALALAESFMEQNPDASISVSGGGSGVGIAALINGKTDIANSSRSFRQHEYQLALQRNVTPEGIVFAMDALAIIVNDRTSIDNLTIEDLGAIFRGEIKNWKELGSIDLPISLYGRQSNSGTYIYFRDSVLGSDYASNLKQMNGTAQMVEGVKNDLAGIAYVGVGYIVQKDGTLVKGIKALSIKADEHSIAVSPLKQENIINGRYPIVRPLLQYTNGKPTGKLKEFILFSLSEQGQQIVLNSGYYPVAGKYASSNTRLLQNKDEEASIH